MADETSEQGTVRYIRCPSCGTPNPATAAACSRCGKSMQGKPAVAPPPPSPPQSVGGQINCPKCRKPLPPTSRFCGYCGAPIAAPAPVAPKPPEQSQLPTQPMPVLSPGRVPPPVPKPAAPPPPPPPPPRPVAPRPPAPVPVAKPPQPMPPPRSAGLAAPPASIGEGTKVFTGLHVPTVEASIIEIKQDGSTGKSIRIVKETVVGRGICDASYPADNLLSPRHASIANRAGKIMLKDLVSQNGTFIKQRQDTELAPGDVFLLGRELFRFATQGMEEPSGSTEGTQVLRGAPRMHPGPVTAKLERIQLTGEVVEEFKLDKPETTLGRTRGDLIFKNDPYMSGEHARVVAQPGRFLLVDLKSRNGVYRKIRAEIELQHGDEFFAGEQIFRADIKVS